MANIKIGIVGSRRGGAYFDIMSLEDDIEIVCTCSRTASPDNPIPHFDNYDKFLEYGKSVGMNAVFLLNFLHQHTSFAIKAMENGMNVISECTASSTLKECVDLVEVVERTGKKFMLAENYQFSRQALKAGQIVKSGVLGTILYAEGEYNHSGTEAELKSIAPSKYHWRAYIPRTYYVTHALGPLMYMTESMPKYVSARAAHSDLMYTMKDWRKNHDGVAMVFCEMDNGMIVRATGDTAMAGDFSRYRIAGDIASVEYGGYVQNDLVRLFYFNHTKPENLESNVQIIPLEIPELADGAAKAETNAQCSGDYWVVQSMIEYFRDGKKPFFDVYRSVAMSAVGILGWRSCLNHGENIRIPDFSIPEERDLVRNDDLTPFPDENGNGATLPAALPYEECKHR